MKPPSARSLKQNCTSDSRLLYTHSLRNELRSSRAATPGQQDTEDKVFLGVLGDSFDFSQLPFETTFAAISAKQGTIEPVLTFLATVSADFNSTI